ncbi:UNVERIFIED_CONTAM: adenylate kinase [Acetivibrio alkalicellulosi]
MVIEFIGIAGTGKTTVLDSFISLKDISGIKLTNLSIYRNTSIKEKIFTILKAIYLTYKLKPINIKGGIKILKLLCSYILKIKAIDNKQQIYFLDEGILHKTREINRHCKCDNMKEIINVIQKKIYIPDCIVVLEADADTIYERRLKRSRKNDFFSLEIIQQNVIDFKDTLCMVDYVKKIYKPVMKIIRINYNKDMTPKEAVNKILSEIDL